MMVQCIEDRNINGFNRLPLVDPSSWFILPITGAASL